MKKLIWAILPMVLWSCSAGLTPEQKAVEESKKNITKLESEVFSNPDQPIDAEKGKQLLGAYLDFSNIHRQDSMAPEYMFKAAEMAMNLRSFTNAIDILQNLRDGFPKFEKQPDVCNWIAFIYDFEINDKVKAREAYNDIITLHPNHRYADDARARLETIHMTDEEWMEWARQKNEGAES